MPTLPSFTTAFAARELAAAGIAVLQVGGGKNCDAPSTSEASCQVSGLASAAKQLAADGLIDIRKIGYRI